MSEPGGYAPADLGRKKVLHPVTGEELPTGTNKPLRLFGSQRVYLRSRIDSLPVAARGTKEDGVLRQIVDDAMRADFGDDYEVMVRKFAEEAAQTSTEVPSPPRREKSLSPRGKKR